MVRKSLKRFVVLFTLILSILAINQYAFAQYEGDDPTWGRQTYEKKVYQIGARLLNANGIQQRFGFQVKRSESKAPNAFIRYNNNQVIVERALLRYIDSDDELAFVLAHEIAHAVNNHWISSGIQKKAVRTAVVVPCVVLDVAIIAVTGIPVPFFSRVANVTSKGVTNKLNQPRETEADLRSIDYMVKAGYNPLAAESIISKIAGDGITIFSNHPKGTERINSIRNYIAAKYPQFLNSPDSVQSQIIHVANLSSSIQPKITIVQSDLPKTQMDSQDTETSKSIESAKDYKIFYLSTNKKELINFDYINDVGYLPYLKELRKKVLKDWYPLNNGKNLTSVLDIKINNMGNINSLKIIEPSGDEIFDMAAIDAVKRSAPFSRFSDKLSLDEIEVKFSFIKETSLSQDPMVVMNLKTRTIHKIGCRQAQICGDSCIKLRRSEAVKKGGRRCKICGG